MRWIGFLGETCCRLFPEELIWESPLRSALVAGGRSQPLDSIDKHCVKVGARMILIMSFGLADRSSNSGTKGYGHGVAYLQVLGIR